MSNAIQTENALAGTHGWQLLNAATIEIQGYCDKTSYSPGDVVTFFVSTSVASTGYTIRVYRLGWYSGVGASLKTTISGLSGQAQGYWDAGGSVLTNDTAQIYDATTHLLDAGWTSSTTWTIPGNACTGMYLATCIDANGKGCYIHFTVKQTTPGATYLYVFPDNTDQAYNDWGGYSLYSTTRAYKVSCNRPITSARGNSGGNLLTYEMPLIRWLEASGYNLAYVSDVDLHTSGATWFNAVQAALFGAHHEYWSYEMRGALETALSQGMGAAFWGANSIYWQIRYEADAGSHANRTVTCYKVLASGLAYATDPEYGVDNTRVTTQWRDALLNRPEAAVIGVQYKDETASSGGVSYAWQTASSVSDALFAGTGLTAVTSYGAYFVGYEYDQTVNGTTPGGWVSLGVSSVVGNTAGADTSNTGYYSHTSGALIFATGSIQWTWALNPYRGFGSYGTPLTIPGMQTLAANVMAALPLARAGNSKASGAFSASFHS